MSNKKLQSTRPYCKPQVLDLFLDTDDETNSETPSDSEPLLDTMSDSTTLIVPTVDTRLYDMLHTPTRNVYAYTLTLKPCFHHEKPEQQYLLFENQLNNKYDVQYYFIPEFTKLGNIHLHGVIDVGYESTRNKLNIHLRKLGFIETKALYNAMGWFDYISKGKTDFEPIHNLS